MADATTVDAHQRIARWVTVWGVVLIVAGFLAVLAPGAAALAAAVFLAAIFLIGGGAEIAEAIATRSHAGFGWKLVAGIAMAILGLLFAFFPVAGIATLALTVGGLLLAHGICSVMFAFKRRPRRGWGWILFDGLLSIGLAILIAIGWPATSIAFIGLLVGFSMISAGVWRIIFARALREEPPPTATAAASA